MTGVYHFSPLETEEPGFEQGQTVELWGDLDRDEGYFENKRIRHPGHAGRRVTSPQPAGGTGRQERTRPPDVRRKPGEPREPEVI